MIFANNIKLLFDLKVKKVCSNLLWYTNTVHRDYLKINTHFLSKMDKMYFHDAQNTRY